MKLRDIVQPKPHEEILLLARASFIPHVGPFLIRFIVFLVPFFLLYPLMRWGTWGAIFLLVLIALGSLYLWQYIFMWSRTIFIITNQRVIDVEQEGFFGRVVTEIRFEDVEDVHYRIKGIFPTLFKYGTIYIVTQGDAANVQFSAIARPHRLHDLLNDLRHAIHE